MRATITDAEQVPVADSQLEHLLTRVYVGGGYTRAETAATLLQAGAVRQRGQLLCARLPSSDELVGMVMVVPPESPARRFAGARECELHLLATAPEYRGHGIGRALVEAAVSTARQQHYERMLLWTQPMMRAAQALYTSAGFVRHTERDFEREGRPFWFFAKPL